MQKLNRLSYAATLFAGVLILLAFLDLSCGEPAPDTPPAVTPPTSAVLPIPSGILPSAPTFDGSDTTAVTSRPAFDHFSWKSFIALVWPRNPDTTRRGVALNPADTSTFYGASNTTPIVWTDYKNQFDLFGQGTNRPSPWNSRTNAVSPCPTGTTNHVFGGGKGATLKAGSDEAFSVPLVDQNKNYVLFEMRYNQIQYDFIRGADATPSAWYYLRKNLVNYQIAHNDSIQLPETNATDQVGSMMLKAAWKILEPGEDESRFYVLNERVYDPVTETCKVQKVGLVAFHIARKIDGFPQWIWSTFEQVDNVPDPGAQKPYNFNNGKTKPETKGGWANRPDSTGLNPDKSKRKITQVTRFNPVPTTPVGKSTVDLNALYQKAMKNTVWKHYKLVITQWPTLGDSFQKLPGDGGIFPKDCGQAFPTQGATNTAAETYFQAPADAIGAGGNSCMSCHYQAAPTDFSWSLQMRAH